MSELAVKLQNNQQHGILTTEEAAELLRLSPYQVRICAARGDIPAFKVGALWRFQLSKLLKHMEG